MSFEVLESLAEFCKRTGAVEAKLDGIASIRFPEPPPARPVFGVDRAKHAHSAGIPVAHGEVDAEACPGCGTVNEFDLPLDDDGLVKCCGCRREFNPYELPAGFTEMRPEDPENPWDDPDGYPDGEPPGLPEYTDIEEEGDEE